MFATKQMELLKFEGEMLTDDGGILRRIKVKGDGYNNPNDGASVDGKRFLSSRLIIDIVPVCQITSPLNAYIRG